MRNNLLSLTVTFVFAVIATSSYAHQTPEEVFGSANSGNDTNNFGSGLRPDPPTRVRAPEKRSERQ